MDPRLQRIASEAALAAVHYSQSKRASYDDEAGRWVIIHDFPLPRGYNYSSTDVLILLPPNYPQTPPDWFYVDYNLRLANGQRPPHVFYNDTSYDPNRSMFRQRATSCTEGLDGLLLTYPRVAPCPQSLGRALPAQRV
jgi:hypothetical protein